MTPFPAVAPTRPLEERPTVANSTRDNEPFRLALGARIRALRNLGQISLDELARRCDLSKTGLWQIETGRTEPRAGTLWRLSRALRVSIDWLVTGKE